MFLFLFCTGSAQSNLVPNYSFEFYSSCPNNSGQLNYATPWINPTSWGSPDYFNSCSALLSVPNCTIGGDCYQYAHTGNAFAGLYTWGYSVPNGREYIQCQTINTLINSKCYFVSFYVNLLNGSMYASNNLGAYISVNQIYSATSNPLLSYNAQILGYKNKIIKDTLSWKLISGIYVAGGGEII